MPERTKRVFRAVAALLSLIALLAILHLGWNQLRDAASLHRQWKFIWIVAAALMQLIVYICIAGMFKLTLRTNSRSLSPLFLIYCAVAFLFGNRSLPGPAVAGVATLVYLLRGKRIPAIDAQAAAASFYFADYAGFFTLIAAVSVPLIAHQSNRAAVNAYLVGISIIVTAAIVALFIFSRPDPFVSFVANCTKRLAFLISSAADPAEMAERVRGTIMELHAKVISVARSPSDLAAFFLLSIGMHFAEVSTVWCCARAAGMHLAFSAGAASYVAGNLASIISVLPGAIGFYEAGMIGTMHVVGHLSIGDSAVCALTYRVLSFWAPLPVVASVLLRVSKEGFSGRNGQESTIRT